MTSFEISILPIVNWGAKDFNTKIAEHYHDDGATIVDVEHHLKSDAIVKCPVCAYAIRKIALECEYPSVPLLKAKWQRLWLRHCLSPDTDYIFQMLGGLKEGNGYINREDDIDKIYRDGLQCANSPLVKLIGAPEGVDFYRETISKWFLSRYNRSQAKKVFDAIEKNKNPFDVVSLFYPRLFVAILVGFLPLLPQSDVWKVPIALSWPLIGFLSVLSIFFAYGYLTYECNNLIRNVQESLKRAAKVCSYGLVVSLLMSFCICFLFGPGFLNLENEPNKIQLATCESYMHNLLREPEQNIGKDVLLFASAALFVGIFIQVFWEEKTITESL